MAREVDEFITVYRVEGLEEAQGKASSATSTLQGFGASLVGTQLALGRLTGGARGLSAPLSAIAAGGTNAAAGLGGVAAAAGAVAAAIVVVAAVIAAAVTAFVALTTASAHLAFTVGSESVRSFVTFEQSLVKIVALVGVTREEVERLGDALVRLGPQVGQTPQALAEGLFFVTSAGIEGERAMEAVEVAAKAAAIGLGDMATIANTVVVAMNVYEDANLSAAQATDVLIATVKLGIIEASELAGTMGQVLPFARQLGVEFHEIGAALATMSRFGLAAAEGTTALRGLFAALLQEAEGGEEVLRGVGLSYSILRQVLREQGLLEMLLLLNERIGDNETAFREVFPELRGMTGALSLLTSDGRIAKEIFAELEASVGATEVAFAAASDSIGFRWSQVTASFEAFRTALGERLGPLVVGVLDRIKGTLDTLATSGVLDKIAEKFEAIFTTIGERLDIEAIVANIVAAFSGMMTFLTNVATAISVIFERMVEFVNQLIAIVNLLPGVNIAMQSLRPFGIVLGEFFGVNEFLRTREDLLETMRKGRASDAAAAEAAPFEPLPGKEGAPAPPGNRPVDAIVRHTAETARNTRALIDMRRFALGGGDILRLGVSPREIDAIRRGDFRVTVQGGSAFERLLGEVISGAIVQLRRQGAL